MTEHTATCRFCSTEVTWTTGPGEPADTEAPFDAAGDYCCDDCYDDTTGYGVYPDEVMA